MSGNLPGVPFYLRLSVSNLHAPVGKKALTLDYTPGCTFFRGVKTMQIGAVAKRIGVSVDAIRFYERNSLLPRAPRLGFKLSEIRSLLSLRRSRMQPCEPVRHRLEAKLADIKRKRENLRRLGARAPSGSAWLPERTAQAPRSLPDSEKGNVQHSKGAK
jgi:MerR family transcriptional regulator, copper efflux regulator